MKDLEPSAVARNRKSEDYQCKRWDTEPSYQQEVNTCVLFEVINTTYTLGHPRNLPENEIFAILKKRHHLRGAVVEKALGVLSERGLVRFEQGKAGRTFFPEFPSSRVNE